MATKAGGSPLRRNAGWVKVAPLWLRRTEIAADWLNKVRPYSVIDIGAGAMALREKLNPGTGYVPVDLVARTPETQVVDLNTQPLPRFSSPAASVLGVVEYLDDVPGFLSQLLRYDTVIISYCHNDFWRSKKKRQPHWHNHYSRRGFKRLLTAAGFRIEASNWFRFGEMIYKIAPDGVPKLVDALP